MPAFKTHRLFNYAFFIVICLLLLYFKLFNTIIMFIFGLGFILGTEILTPDLDTKSTPSKRAGFLWIPYNHIRKHRGVSHSFVQGFFERILYLFVLICILVLIFRHESFVSFIIFLSDPSILAILFVSILGIGFANGLHIILDKIT